MKKQVEKRTSGKRGGVKLLSLLLATAFIMSFLVYSGTPVEASGLANKNQVVQPGGTKYYLADGTEADASYYDVGVTKKVTQAADAGGNALENQFKVDLTVETTTDYENIVVTKDAAVVLALDLSSSMSDCADCGRPAYPDPKDFTQTSYNRVQAHYVPGTTPQYYCYEKLSNADAYYGVSLYSPSGAWGSDCAKCRRPFASHTEQHLYASRLETAKKNVLSFLEKYIKDVGSAKRKLSVVVFSDYNSNPALSQTKLVLNWTDIAQKSSAEIKTLVDSIFSSGNMGGDTCTTGGMYLAMNQIKALTDIPKNQSSVILMTDGLPGANANSNYGATYNSGAFLNDYQNVINYCQTASSVLGEFVSYGTAFRSVAAYGYSIRDLGASLYTVSFASGYFNDANSAPDYGYLANYLGMIADKGYDAHNANLLEAAFTEIIENMTELRPNTVTDFLPSYLHFNNGSFQGTGASNASAGDGLVSWVLSQVRPDKTELVGTQTRYTYKLSYTMTLDNTAIVYDATGIAASDVNVLNKAPMFRFQAFSNGVVSSRMQTVLFDRPKVESYASVFTLVKVDPENKIIPKTGAEAGVFQLSTADGSWKQEVKNDNNGRVVFENVPSGHSYILKEIQAPWGFVKDTTEYNVTASWKETTAPALGNPGNGYVLKNLYDTKNKTITVQKEWIDSTEIYKTKTVTYTIALEDSVTKQVVGNITGTLNTANAVPGTPKIWKDEVTVPTIDENTGHELLYSITETPIIGYKATYDRNGENTLIIQNKAETLNLTVRKEWVDPDQNAVHPDITINLYNSSDENALPVKSLTLASGASEVTFTDLPILDDNGNAVQYRVGEDPVSNYRLSNITGTMYTGYTITNTNLDCTTTNISVHKHWYDNNDVEGKRPDSVTVTLEKRVGDNGTWEAVTQKTLTENDALVSNNSADTNVWAWVFTGMQTHTVANEEITYRVVETRDPSWAAFYTTSYNGIDINNTINTTSVTVRKTWAKPDDLSTPNATFRLLRNNVQYGESYIMVSPETEHTFKSLPRTDANGVAYTYKVVEDAVSGYKTDASKAPSFTNTIAEAYDVKVSGHIKWELRSDGEEVLPQEVTVRLYANGVPAKNLNGNYVDIKTSAEKNWDFTFNGALRYTLNGSGRVAYSVRELGANGEPASDASTILFVSGTDGETRNFGAHYYPVEVDQSGNYTCNIRNHTDAEAKGIYSVQINRFYNDYLDGNPSPANPRKVLGTAENGGYIQNMAPISLTVDTGTYLNYEGQAYAFEGGTVGTGNAPKTKAPALKEGSNDFVFDEADCVYIVSLYYEHRSTTPPKEPDPIKPVDPTPTEPAQPEQPVKPDKPTVFPDDPDLPDTPGFKDTPEEGGKVVKGPDDVYYFLDDLDVPLAFFDPPTDSWVSLNGNIPDFLKAPKSGGQTSGMAGLLAVCAVAGGAAAGILWRKRRL